VQRHLVAGGGLVDGFHDVDFAVGGPVGGVGCPEGGPGRATVGGWRWLVGPWGRMGRKGNKMCVHTVHDVKDEEACGVLVLRCQTCRVTTSRGICFGVVDAEDGTGGGGECEVHLCGLCWIGVARN